MTAALESRRSILPALGGMVALLVVIMGVVFTGYHQQETHLERMLQVSSLNESITQLERQLTDGYRFLSLASDDLLGTQQGVEVNDIVVDFKRRLDIVDSLNTIVRISSEEVGVEQGGQISRRVADLGQSWMRVIEAVRTDPTHATVELVTVSDPLSVELLSSELPALLGKIIEIRQTATRRYERVSGVSFIVIVAVFLAAYMIALVLISHILSIERDRADIEVDLRVAMERAREANLEKSRFLSNMSHELRTPMNGVIGMANVLASRPLPEDQKRLVSVLKDSADTALNLINDILDFEAIEAGKVSVENRSFELMGVARKIKALVSAQLVTKPIAFNISMDTALPSAIRGDEGRLVQILTNLVSNAIKFTEEGSVQVTISRTGKDRIGFSVSDSGIGIEQDRIESLFESFKQADNSIKRRFGGTGLGLSITRSLVHMMGGSIQVESTPGLGSTFNVELPLPAVELPLPAESNSAAEAVVSASTLRVLCVDDNLINLEVARAVLEEAGHVCLHASSGLEALARADAEVVDVVLMDCHMDGMDGYETARRLLEWNPDLPVIALTADATKEAIASSKKAGMRGLLTKPFKPRELVRALEGIRRQGEVTASGVSSSSA